MSQAHRKQLDLSFIVVAYNMDRELPRTLKSLSKSYQQGAQGIDYEVLVVDNGSQPSFGSTRVVANGDYFRYIYLENASESPAHALNYGVEQSRGTIVCMMIDGARIASPGIARWALSAFRAFDDPTVAVLGWHLGPRIQNQSVNQGYNQDREDSLLEQIAFPDDGYRLFEISVFASSCGWGWFLPFPESNAVFLRKKSYWNIGGYDERFDVPGGGLLNLDFYRRAVLRDDRESVILLGEGLFHQIHGGIATNTREEDLRRKFQSWRAQYKEIRGADFMPPKKRPIYLGTVPPTALRSIEASARKGMANQILWG